VPSASEAFDAVYKPCTAIAEGCETLHRGRQDGLWERGCRLAQVFDAAFGVGRGLAGISLGQAGLGSGGAAQVGLVPSKMTPKGHEYKPSGSRMDTSQVDRGKE
jgi:hypothetical protein